MELALLKLAGLLRPIGSIQYARVVFDIFGIGLFVLLVGAFLMNSALRKTISLSAIDAVVIAFATWCLAVDLIYFDVDSVPEVARALSKVLIPLLTYIVVKNVIRGRDQYISLLSWIIVGFLVPMLWSTYIIMRGEGVEYIAYWTELPRFEGVYEGAHSLGHSMTLFVMVLAVYVVVAAPKEGQHISAQGAVRRIFIFVLLASALYCLYKSQVRSALLGLAVFTVVCLFYYNKKLLVFGSAAVGIIGMITLPFWLPVLVPEVAVKDRGVQITTMDYGSGRPRIWLNDFKTFSDLPLDRQIAGVGLGNQSESGDSEVFYGHNDWLEVLTQTGIVGLLLFATLQILILRAILRMPGREKYVFFAAFVAVQVMMAVSNSYLWRIQVSHLYYMMLAFIEVSARENRTDSARDFTLGREPELTRT